MRAGSSEWVAAAAHALTFSRAFAQGNQQTPPPLAFGKGNSFGSFISMQFLFP